MIDIFKVIAQELNLKTEQVKIVIELFQQEATAPFIARYRKDKTGGLKEEQLRNIEDRWQYLTILEERKQSIIKSIEEQGKLTPELKERIENSLKLQEVEDLYLPYKPKRKTRGTIAKSKGLEPLALFILDNPKFKGDLIEIAKGYVNVELGAKNEKEAIQGAKDIIAEMISDNADIRKFARETIFEKGHICSSKSEDGKETEKKKDTYQIYYEFKSPIKSIKPYQTLAINRGENEGFLKVSLQFEKDEILNGIYSIFTKDKKTVFEDLIKECCTDAFQRLIFPSIEREIRNELTEIASSHAIEIFAANLRQLLLQPPVYGKIIMGIDPGYVSGCKVAVIDTTGKYLKGDTIYPHAPQNRLNEAETIVVSLIKKYKVDVIAIGNGTASRETEFFIADLLKKHKLKTQYVIVSEAGASVYSASPLAKEEFPELDAAQRGNISIARRLLDPLAELVKIDPKSIGVGLYQHDVNQKELAKKLDYVVNSCVNYVGVDINTASASLLSYVSGLNKRLANNIVKYRERIGKFLSRTQILEVPGVGEKIFEQCAGFLKISDGVNPLDNTFIHPESYEAANAFLKFLNLSIETIKSSPSIIDLNLKNKKLESIADKLGIGIFTLQDIIENLKKPGRDPREELPKPIFRSDAMKIEDLQIGMKLKGVVRNIVDFGAFVDIGVKQDGLLHISQISNKFIKNPLEALKVGDIIDVEVISIDIEKGRISLSSKNFDLSRSN